MIILSLKEMSLEGNPFIIRFKTFVAKFDGSTGVIASLEGNPFIIRFKTRKNFQLLNTLTLRLEGNPFIIRFKTLLNIPVELL